jgi:hypothetical protein
MTLEITGPSEKIIEAGQYAMKHPTETMGQVARKFGVSPVEVAGFLFRAIR